MSSNVGPQTARRTGTRAGSGHGCGRERGSVCVNARGSARGHAGFDCGSCRAHDGPRGALRRWARLWSNSFGSWGRRCPARPSGTPGYPGRTWPSSGCRPSTHVEPCRIQCESHPQPASGGRSGRRSRWCTSGYGTEGWPLGTDLERDSEILLAGLFCWVIIYRSVYCVSFCL